MGKTYQVVGAAAMVTQNTPHGPMKMLLYAGHILNDGVTAAEIEHNVAGGFIRAIGGDDEPAEPVDDVVMPVVGGDAGQGESPEGGVKVDGDTGDGAAVGPETEAARAEAKAKLPADGTAPAKNAATAVWVEYAVSKGYLYDDCVKETREALIALTASK